MTMSTSSTALYGGTSSRRITVRDIARAKRDGERWPMLTAYDALTARVFDQAGIPVLLVGDSAAMVVYGYDSTVPVTVDDLVPLTAAVARSTSRSMVVADLPFGSYQGSAEQALDAAARFMKEGGAHAVKLEGGHRITHQVETLVAAGIPVMGHIGLTPQSVHTLGGYRSRGAVTTRPPCSPTPRSSNAPARSRSSWSACPPASRQRSPSSSPSPRSASEPGREPTPRCWSGRTWPG